MPSKIKANGTVGVSLPKKERKILILKQVNIHTRLMFNDLVNLIDVSEDTIRRDVNKLAEEGRVNVRNARRDSLETVKKAKLPEDDAKRLEKDIQAATDAAIKSINEFLAAKEKELLTV